MTTTRSVAALVQDAAEARLSHGERTFAYGIAGLGLTGVGLIAASLLRVAGLV